MKITEKDIGMFNQWFTKESITELVRMVSNKNLEHILGIGTQTSKHIIAWRVGDILVSENGNETKILSICGKIYFISNPNMFDDAEGRAYTRKNLEEMTFKLK